MKALKLAAISLLGILALFIPRQITSAATDSQVHARAMTASSNSRASCCTTPSELALYSTMRNLWAQHMEWTYATVAAFAANSPGLGATLTRLLQNQTDLGNAIKPFYGNAAGNELSKLLHAHIEGYVPLLTDAKAGHAAKAKRDFAAILANGVQIGKFLEEANPKNWPAPQIEHMMNMHNRQTLKYASDQLKGNYAASIADYGTAEAHMYQMGDVLTAGIVAQFPGRFNR